MKEIRSEGVKEGLENFLESFRNTNDDVTNYAAEKVVTSVTKEKGYSRDKVSERRIPKETEGRK